MSRVGDQLPPPRRGSQGIDSNNKVKIPNGTKMARIIEFWVYNVNKEGRFQKEFDPEFGKKVRVKFQFVTRPDIVLDKRFKLYLGEKSHWSIFLAAVTGIPATKDTADHPSPQRHIDLDDLLIREVLVTTEYTEPYTDIIAVMAPPDEDDFGDATAHTPAPMTPAQPDTLEVKRRLTAALHTHALFQRDIDEAVKAVTGSPETGSIKTPALAVRVIEEIDRRIRALDEEIPF